VLLDDGPLLVALGAFELIDELDEIVVAFLGARLLLVLADEALAKPLTLVEVAIGVQPGVAQERTIGLLDEQLEAKRPAIDPGTDVVGAAGGVAGLAIDLVGERLGQGEAIHVLVDQVDRRHSGQGMILVEANLAAGVARRDLNE